VNEIAESTSDGASSGAGVTAWLLLMVAGFFLLLVPTVASGHYFFGDERFYTDAAIHMVQKGEVFAPHYIDGLPHFNKPILTYWAVLGSFKLFGIGLIASRLPSLLAACAALVLTFLCGLSLLGRRDEALLAVVILGANSALVAASTRATPDMLLTLSLLASFCGFSALLFGGEKSFANYLLAYGGAALAVEAKGFLGLMVIAYVYLFWVFARPKDVRFADLLEPKSIALAVLVAFSWFVIATLQYGSAVWGDFFGDQVTDNLDETHVSHLRNVLFLLGATLQHFFPWTLLLLVSAIPGAGRIAAFWRQHRKAYLFVLGWYGLLVVVFCMSNRPRGRYLLPAYPLLAVMLSGMLMAVLRDRTSVRLQRRTSAALLVVGTIAGVALIAAGSSIDPRLVSAGGALLVGNSALLVLMRRASDRGVLIVLGVAFFLLLAISSALVRPVFMAAPEESMAQELLDRGIRSDQIVTVDLPPHAASHLGLWSGGLLASSPQRDDVTWDELARFPVILLSDTARKRWAFDGYRITACGYEYPDWSASDLWKLLTSPDKREFMAGKRRTYFIASRDDHP
jgi:4-amino-4-deoxy-L-arabinose transferase-like glycosyltransferase